jgi:ribosome-associated protein
MMNFPPVAERNFLPEFRFQTARSSGPGGPHVNKTETRVELYFHVVNSALLKEEENERILQKLQKRINAEGELMVSSEKTRSQAKNKEDCITKFYDWIEKALHIPKKRVRTRPTGASVKKRLEGKRLQSEKKSLRKKP